MDETLSIINNIDNDRSNLQIIFKIFYFATYNSALTVCNISFLKNKQTNNFFTTASNIYRQPIFHAYSCY